MCEQRRRFATAAWHYSLRSLRLGGRGLVHSRGQRDAGGPQGEAGGRPRRGANHEALAVVFDFGLGQRVEIGNDLRPGTETSERGDAVLQRLL